MACFDVRSLLSRLASFSEFPSHRPIVPAGQRMFPRGGPDPHPGPAMLYLSILLPRCQRSERLSKSGIHAVLRPRMGRPVRGNCLLALFVGALFALGMGAGLATAQRPGTDPPRDVFSESQENEDEGGIPIQAFLFQSESETPVMMPDMTFEELERLQNLDEGIAVPSQGFSYTELQIVGDVTRRRAELEITLRMEIESTGSQWLAIPLRMSNFHRLAPPDVSGVEDYSMSIARDRGGYLLWVKTSGRRDATLKMKASARVESTSTTSTLEFHLPDVTSEVTLRTDMTNASGDVSGRGPEMMDDTGKHSGGKTQLHVESSGGDFEVRWGRMKNEPARADLLEVSSQVDVDWSSPQDAPRAAVRLTVRNETRPIEQLEIELPAGAVVSTGARLGAGGQSVDFETASGDSGSVRRISIPLQEQGKQIYLNFSFNLRLPNGNVSAANPLLFRVPQVVGATRHRGGVSVETAEEFRLRWRADPRIRNVMTEANGEASSKRAYEFKFDRSGFVLPIWLSAKQRQVQITADSQITFLDDSAAIDMLIRSSARAANGQGPLLSAEGWQIQSIVDADGGQAIDSFRNGELIEIDASAGTGPPPPIRVRATRPLRDAGELIAVALPRIVTADESLLAPTSTVEVIPHGRRMFSVDLAACKHLQRLVSESVEGPSPPASVRFRVDDQGEPAVLSGSLLEQPPRITLATSGTISLDGDHLVSTIDWIITSESDLEGRLPVRIPQLPDAELKSNDSEGAVALLNPASLSNGLAADWTVTVSGLPATLNALAGDRFEVVSPYLADDTMSIRWRRRQPLSSKVLTDATELLGLPRPAFEDVEISGNVRIELRDTPATELLSASAENTMVLEALPPDPIRLRVRSRVIAREELSVTQMVLRTAVGRSIRHEQVLAKIQGGETFKVGLPPGTRNLTHEAWIDDRRETVRRDGDMLVLSLPGDQQSHVIDLRLYADETVPSGMGPISPMMRLPVGAGRVYWQIVTPLDSHLVWAAPTIGRSMTWKRGGWKLGREPTYDDRQLTALVGSQPHAMPPGNRYLYTGSDVGSFQAVAVSRVVLWLLVAGVVLLAATILTQLPKTRHPLTAVAGALVFAGLLVIAPDAAVLTGQLASIALVLVVVMIAVKALVAPPRSDRIFAPRESPSARRQDGSTQTLPAAVERRSSIQSTQAVPTEAPP